MSFSLALTPLLLALTFIPFALTEQPDTPAPIAAPLRELPWGQLNFLHTTDTHGWHGGHLQEAQYGADWGDYISFAHHLRNRADADGSDLLVIDSGDRVEGNGLYDASKPKGKYTFDIVREQTIDVLTVGNHELYKRNTSEREFAEVVPDFKDAYVASNLDIYDPRDGKRVPMALRFRKFTTKNQGIRIISFGFIFNFKGNANNTVVQEVQDTVKEQWFQDAIRDKEVDLFMVVAHAPVRGGPEIDAIYKAIRAAKWDTPIIFFGGHTHIRDYRELEKKAYALESGRYMETIGFLSISGLGTSQKDVIVPEAAPTYKRLYIDNNLFSLHHHSATNASTFDTEHGQNVSRAIASARKDLKLNHRFGCAPQDYWLNRAPYPSKGSLVSWLEKEVLPDTFAPTNRTSIVIANTGAMRFDIFKGAFTIDTTFLVSPFTSGFRTLRDVPYPAAKQVLKLLNNEGPILTSDLLEMIATTDGANRPHLDQLLPPYIPASPSSQHAALAYGRASSASLREPAAQAVLEGEKSTAEDDGKSRVPGYTTTDDAGTDGDDTIHRPIAFYAIPNCVASYIGFEPVPFSSSSSVSALATAESAAQDGSDTPASEPETVDVVYNEFIQDWVLLALRYLGEKRERGDAAPALGGTSMTDIISTWVREHWHCEGEREK